MPERTYTEAEIAALFAKAAEHEHLASARDSSPGLTLAEVEQAGREAGLDPASIRAAAMEMDAGHRYPTRSKIAVAERWVEAPISAGAWEDLVASLRRQFGTNTAWWAKDTASLGEAQEWTHVSGSGVSTTVTFSPREGRALLRVMQEYAGLEDGLRMGWLIAAFLALIPSVLAGALVAEGLGLGDGAGFVAVALVLILGTALGGPALAARVRESRARGVERVHQIADDLVKQLGGDRPKPVARDSAEALEPRLDLSALEAPDSGERSPSGKQRARS